MRGSVATGGDGGDGARAVGGQFHRDRPVAVGAPDLHAGQAPQDGRGGVAVVVVGAGADDRHAGADRGEEPRGVGVAAVVRDL